VGRRLPEVWSVEPLAARHDRAEFSCGVESLDRYLKTQATQDTKRFAASVYVLTEGGGRIAGYYTLSAMHLDAGSLPPDIEKKLPRYRYLPATLIGRLAVDARHQGKGFGQSLLFDAVLRCWEASQEVASIAVVVDALDERAARFYTDFGFAPLSGEELRLFMLMKSVEKLAREQ